ncbi:MAG: DNA polymerase III subunit beta [Rhodospirillaceae bacterium]|nr:DNA polymerase III subunit beta [Rhodospirillaceae bacterium]
MSLKFTIERAALHGAMSALAKVVKASTTIPILSCVKLASENGRLTISATDMDIFMTLAVDVAGEDSGAACVSAADLARIAAVSPEGSQISFAAAENVANVKVGRARHRLETLPVEDFPALKAAKNECLFVIAANDIIRAFNACFACISTEETRYYLNGIYMHADIDKEKARLHFVATDGHRLTHLIQETDADTVDSWSKIAPGIILPRTAVAHLQRLLPADGAIEVTASASLITFAWADLTFTTKLIDGSFPDYRRVIPSRYEQKVDLPMAEARGLVSRIVGFTGRDEKRKDRSIRMSLEAGSLTVSTGPSAAEIAKDEIEIQGPAQPVQLGVNGAYFISALETADGDVATLSYSDSVSPYLMTYPADPGLTRVVMPLRI